MSGTTLSNSPLASGGGVDASIPLRAGQFQQPNPLQQTSQLADTINKINQTKLFPGQLQLQQQAIKGGAATVAAHLNQVGANAMVPALSDPNLSMESLTHYAGAAEGVHGGITQGIMGQVAAVPYAPNTPEWQRAVKGIIASQAQVNPAEGVAQVTGPLENQNVGGRILSGVRAPAYAGGGFNPGSATPLGLSPEAAAQRTQIGTNPQGDPIFAPLATVTPGEPLFNNSNGRYAPTPTSPGIPALHNPKAAPAAPGIVQPPAGSPLGATVMQGPQTQAAQQATGAQSAERFQNVATEGTLAKEQDAVLANMQNDLKNFTSGPGAKTVNELEKIVQGWVPGVNSAFKTKIAAQESFDKLANQLVTTAAPGSDARQAVLQGATPNSAQSPEGVDFILRQLRGMADYKQARANVAAAPGVNRGDYAGWQATSANQLNPQVFQFARLTPEQQKTFFTSIPEKERASFKRQYLQARQAGFYGIDNGGQ